MSGGPPTLRKNHMTAEPARSASDPTPASLTAVEDLVESSIKMILDHQAGTGAYPASPTFSAYAGYCWFRDGSFIADAMSAVGHPESAEAFFDWCARIIEAREGQIRDIVALALAGTPAPDADMLPTRYTFAEEEGSEEWWDFQLDGYGMWLWALGEHRRRYQTDLTRWSRAIGLIVEYLCSSWRRPCFDWWEEFAEHTHVSTLGSIAAGLSSIATADVLPEELVSTARQSVEEIMGLIGSEGVHAGHLTKWIGSEEVDASLLALIAPMSVIEAGSTVAVATVREIENRITDGNGVYRYAADTYYGGGQWPLLSCFLGLAHASAGHHGRAREILDWAATTAGADGSLPEQVDWRLLAPEHFAPWVERWGKPADPLLWSHAMFLRLAAELRLVRQLTTPSHSEDAE